MLGMIKAEFVAWAKAYDGPKFHAVLCDPPYGLEFMGKEWDAPHKRDWRESEHNFRGYGRKAQSHQLETPRFHAGKSYQAWTTEWAQVLLPLLHPGALVFAFGGTRTWHRLACGFEDAGFEMWDTLMWLHGQGFPKAQAIDKLIDKEMGTTDKRSVIGRKPDPRYKYKFPESSRPYQGKTEHDWTDEEDTESMANVTAPGSIEARPWSGHKTAALKPAWESILCFRAPRQGKNYAELALEHGSGALNVDGGRIAISESVDFTEVERCNPEKNSNLYELGFKKSKTENPKYKPEGRYPANLVLECTCERTEMEKAIRHTDPDCPAYLLDEQAGDRPGSHNQKPHPSKPGQMFIGIQGYDGHGKNDKGGPSRFFYCAKASRSERGKDNRHPTVKPVALTKWLPTLLLPPDSVRPRRLLVPFAGSGSEMIGAIKAGWDEIVGIEQSGEYAEINSGLAVQPPLLR